MSDHYHWNPEGRGRMLPEGWERVPSSEVFLHRPSGRVLVGGKPHEEPPNGEGHSCDEMGCASIGSHNLIWARLESPEDLKP